jgi:hypothetical protein
MGRRGTVREDKMALGSSPNPGIVGKDAMQAIEHDPRHADDAVSEGKAELEAEKAGEPPATAEPRKRSWLDRLLGRGG